MKARASDLWHLIAICARVLEEMQTFHDQLLNYQARAYKDTLFKGILYKHL